VDQALANCIRSLASQAFKFLRQHGEPKHKQLRLVGLSGFDLPAQLRGDFSSSSSLM
jgi:hypothetical protein